MSSGAEKVRPASCDHATLMRESRCGAAYHATITVCPSAAIVGPFTGQAGISHWSSEIVSGAEAL